MGRNYNDMDRALIILTGASGGIGRAILPALSKLDKVIAISHRNSINIDNLDSVEPYNIHGGTKGKHDSDH